MITKSDEIELIKAAETICQSRILQPAPKGHCGATWDGITCWLATKAGETSSQPCASYVQMFTTQGTATKRCMDDGTWFVNTDNNNYSNYSACYEDNVNYTTPTVPPLIKKHMQYITTMYNVGYTVSLLSLVTAVLIMTAFRRLHCARNVIHINLFVSFILRAAMSLMKDALLVEKVGFSTDVKKTENGALVFLQGPHWECKLFFTVFHYILSANYAWVLAEGMYLYTLIHVAVFTESSSVKYFIIGGWGCPILPIIPWVIVRAKLDDTFCWNINTVKEYFWILKVPIILTILANFVFFISIIYVLFTKLVGRNVQEQRRYRKLAKSTLVLIPLFGVHYILFIWLPEDGLNEMAELIKLYYEMFFNSFQGFVISLLFCFLNGEVRWEFKKRWQRYNLQRNNGTTTSRTGSLRFATSMTTVVRGNRASVHSTNGDRVDHSANNGKQLVTSVNLDKAKMQCETIQDGRDCEESKLMLDIETRNL